MPTARAPLMPGDLARPPQPTAPEAAATTTVSPACGLPDLQKARVGGHPRHAEDTERGRDRRQRRIDLAHALAVGHRVGPPAGTGEHDVAGSKPSGSRPRPRSPCRPPSPARSRPAWRRTAHRSSGRACRDRATATACATASRPSRPRDRHVIDAEVACLRLADRPRRKQDAPAIRHAHARLG